jgi:hypothetical protein
MQIEKEVWIYWLFCLLAIWMIAANSKSVSAVLPPKRDLALERKRYKILLCLSWAITLLAGAGYVGFTHKLELGRYPPADVLLFAVANGALETFMFLFWFLLGCWLMRRISHNRAFTFLSGFVTYSFYSGYIHATFWLAVLPKHIPVTALMAVLLTIMSCLWLWLFWRYRKIVPIIAMHATLDFIMAGYLHALWPELPRARIG